jgi:hypothetical protein
MARRNVTLEGWRAALLDEALFRAAAGLSASTEPARATSIVTTLEIRISADQVTGALELRFDSVVEGPVTTVLSPPF